MNAAQDRLSALRRSIAAVEGSGLQGAATPEGSGVFALGLAELDRAIGGGLRRGALHDLVAAGLPDAAALTGFAAGLARRAAEAGPIVWARQDYVELEAGRLDPHGLAEFGLDPGGIVLVRARDPTGVLRAGAEAVRCGAVGAVLIELWGEPKALDLTATRRLALAAARSGVTAFLVHVLARPGPNAAATRWRVAAAPSAALEANAPGGPAFAVTLLRHRGGFPSRVGTWSGIVTHAGSGAPRRYLALWFPFLPAERLRRLGRPTRSGAPDRRPLVLVETQKGALRLCAVAPDALALGLAPGLTLADARARAPDLAVAEADPAADARLLDRLAEDCDRWTMLVQLDPPDGITLDVTGCAHLFGGEAAMLAKLRARFRRGRLTLRATIAGTPDAARGLARFGRADIVPPGQDAEAVASLPVAALGLDRETGSALNQAGLKTLGALAERSSTPLAARFGEELATRLRRVLGREDIRVTPRRPAPDYAVEQRFAEPIGRASDIEGTLAALARQAAALLDAQGQGGRRFEAAFFRADGQVRRIAVETGLPSRDPAALLRLFRERLDALTDPVDPGFGFDLIRLAVLRAEPLASVQPSLDGRAVAEEELAELVDRLVARFGRERVLRFTAHDTHDPDRAARLAPAGDATTSVAWPAPEPGEPGLRPLQVFDPPQPIDTLAEVPDGPPIRFRWRRVLHEIARAEGPERIAPEWWRRRDEVPTRDYYRIEDRDGRRFWVFRAGLYGGPAGAGEPRWFLHGLFP